MTIQEYERLCKFIRGDVQGATASLNAHITINNLARVIMKSLANINRTPTIGD